MSKKTWYILTPFIMGALIFFDQITKYWARRDLADEPFSLIKGVFGLELVQNEGAAWGMLKGKVDFLSIISVIMVILIAFFFYKIPVGKKYNIMHFLSIAVISGALGNLIDRIWTGSVTDFLYIELIDFPVFNVADCYITFSMFFFIILMIFYYKDEDIEFMSFKKSKVTDSGDKKDDGIQDSD